MDREDLLYVIKGSLRVDLHGGESHVLHAGEAFVIPAGTRFVATAGLEPVLLACFSLLLRPT